jgi:hypothetical protein
MTNPAFGSIRVSQGSVVVSATAVVVSSVQTPFTCDSKWVPGDYPCNRRPDLGEVVVIEVAGGVDCIPDAVALLGGAGVEDDEGLALRLVAAPLLAVGG